MMEQPQTLKKEAEPNFDFYGPSHKAQRRALFMLAEDAGKVDPSDQNSLSRIQTQLTNLNGSIRRHVNWEEKAVHPLIAQRIPGIAERIEEEHKQIHHQLDNLINNIGTIASAPQTFERKAQRVQEFYISLNSFIAKYLAHIGYEENYVMPNLWNLSTNDELRAAGASYQGIAQPSPEEMKFDMELMVGGISIDDLTQLLKIVKKAAPPQVLQFWLATAQRMLAPDVYEKLKARLET